MNVKIGKSPLNDWQVRIISSKSDGHRAMIAAALAEEECVLFLEGWNDDLEATSRCIEGLGCGNPPARSLFLSRKMPQEMPFWTAAKAVLPCVFCCP